jgi:hypothetical protein
LDEKPTTGFSVGISDCGQSRFHKREPEIRHEFFLLFFFPGSHIFGCKEWVCEDILLVDMGIRRIAQMYPSLALRNDMSVLVSFPLRSVTVTF